MELQANTMIHLAHYPVLQALAKFKTKADRLDARACNYIYANGSIDANLFCSAEKALFDALHALFRV